MGGGAWEKVTSGCPVGPGPASYTYTLLPDGSTYGMLARPLVASQVAGPGDTLEILGPTGGASFRTNLALVDVCFRAGTAHVEALDENGTLLDAFDQAVPSGGNVQVDDLLRARGLGDGPKAALLQLSLSPDVDYVRTAAYATTIANGTNDPVAFGDRVTTED
jgi:hypothetical protein